MNKTQRSTGNGGSTGDKEHVEVLIVGAGIAGIAAAYHLQQRLPHKQVAILEGASRLGGTWNLFKYPGVRSDSDMFTLGFSFKPWDEQKCIAQGGTILTYLEATAKEYHIDKLIRYQHRVVNAHFSSRDAAWTVDVQVGRNIGAGEKVETAAPPVSKQIRCSFLLLCTGYYRYDEGFAPRWEGMEDFKGQVIHPQHWPESIELRGKNVVVIGSGATAVTLLPSIVAAGANKTTMLQRSPSYMAARPSVDVLSEWFKKWLPATLAYFIIRWRNILVGMWNFWLCRTYPEWVKKQLFTLLKTELPDGYDVAKHFQPSYNPWDQRFCLVPDSDFFKALHPMAKLVSRDAVSRDAPNTNNSDSKTRSRADKEHEKPSQQELVTRAEIVTDHIKRFDVDGIQLQGGVHLPADIIVSATGLQLQFAGGMGLFVDGRKILVNEQFTYKGCMLSSVPNAAFLIGYTNASWTLKCELIAKRVCDMLQRMDDKKHRIVIPLPQKQLKPVPLFEFSSGYITRSASHMPKQASEAPWQTHQNCVRDILSLRMSKLEDGVLHFLAAATREDEESFAQAAAIAANSVSHAHSDQVKKCA